MYQNRHVVESNDVFTLYDLGSWIKMLLLCTGKELESLALEVGFSKGKHYEIGGGLMGNLVAVR